MNTIIRNQILSSILNKFPGFEHQHERFSTEIDEFSSKIVKQIEQFSKDYAADFDDDVLMIYNDEDLIQCKSMPFDEREIEKLTGCNKPNRTSGQLILKPTRKRKLTLAQLLLKRMFKTMIRRKSTDFVNEKVHTGRRKLKRKPIKLKPRRPYNLQNKKRKLIQDFK